MKLKTCLTLFLLLYSINIYSQEFLKIWPVGKMPNSKGINVQETIENYRITQVDTPGVFAFLPPAEENKNTAVIICPGGGYGRLAYLTTGFQLAKWFNTMGITAFVLKYRLPHSPDVIERHTAPLQDAQRAIRFVRANAVKWDLDINKIGIMGTSAGGHLAASLATYQENISSIGDTLDNFSFSPNFQILVSPVITMGQYTHAGSKRNLITDDASEELIKKFSNQLQVTQGTPPAFIVHAVNDKSVNLNNSLMYHKALIDNNVSASLHVFPQGGHSIAMRNNPGSTALWTELCELWLIEMGFLK